MSEQVIASRMANAQVAEAEMAQEPAAVVALRGQDAAVEAVVEWFRSFQGGLWVGGHATLTDQRLHFEANSLNKMVHVGPMEVDVDLRHVIDVAVRRSPLATTIHVLLPGAVFRLRCWGARGFAEQVRDAVRAARDRAM